MHNFKKAMISVLCTIICVAAVSAFLIAGYYGSEAQVIQDSRLRASLAGTIDTFVIGSSLAWNGFNPVVFDQRTGTNSYDLSGGVMPMYAKRYLAAKELGRNPVKTVYIEIAPDTMTRTNEKDYSEGDEIAIAKLDSMSERIGYMHRYLSIDDCINVYSRVLSRGLQAWAKMILGSEGLDHRLKGFYPKSASDVSLDRTEAAAIYNTDVFTTDDYLPENMEELKKLISECKASGSDVVLVVFPESDNFIWEHDNLDGFRKWVTDFCSENDVRYYDFNLLKKRYSILNDHSSYCNTTHLSEEGAKAFTDSFAEVIETDADSSADDLFYKSYAEMKKDSPYTDMQ